MIPHLCLFELEIKMADEDEIFRKFRRKTPEWMADFEKPCFSLELEIFKSTTNDGEPAPAVETEYERDNIFRIMLHGICEKPSKLSSVV